METSQQIQTPGGRRARDSQRSKVYRAENSAMCSVGVMPLDGSTRAAQELVDKVVRSAWFKRTCEVSYYGDHTYGGKILYGTNWLFMPNDLPDYRLGIPRKILVCRGQGSGGIAPHRLRKHRGRWVPSINLGAIVGKITAEEYVRSVAMTGKTLSGIRQTWYPAIANPWIVLHEIAHIMTPSDPGHGPTYAWVYLDTVRRWLGQEAASALRKAYREQGVRYLVPRKGSA